MSTTQVVSFGDDVRQDGVNKAGFDGRLIHASGTTIAMSGWPFEEPTSVAVVTAGHVTLVASPEPVVRRRPAAMELADLPLGWAAARERAGAPWFQRCSAD